MDDLGDLIGSWFRGKSQSRFQQGPWPEQVRNPLDINDPVIQDMISRAPKPYHVENINLSVAGSKQILVPGFHVVMYGYQTNSAIKAVNTQAFMDMYWGINKSGTPFPAKHARGMSAPFQGLWLEWPAQANVSVDLVIWHGMYRPYIDGESCT